MPKNHKDRRGWTDAKASVAAANTGHVVTQTTVTYPVGILPAVAADDAEERPGVEAIPRPARSANKAAWVVYAIFAEIDPSGTKREIIARVGG